VKFFVKERVLSGKLLCVFVCVCVERERERERESSWLLCSTHFLVFSDVPVFVLHVGGSLQERV
jgi:hypothetical protein